jgi:hypothetical protein
MTQTRKTKGAMFGTFKMFISIGMLLSTFSCQTAQAATDDVAFKECLQVFGQSPDALTTDAWHTSPLDAKVAQLEKPNLYGSVIIRWISHKNQNGTTTIVVLTRDPDPQSEDDPDGFDVILEQQGHLSLKASVGVNGLSFSKESDEGVNGFLFCTRGQTFKWKWNGSTWKYYNGSASK